MVVERMFCDKKTNQKIKFYYLSLDGDQDFFKGFPNYFRDVFLVKQMLDLETFTTCPRTKTFSVLPGAAAAASPTGP